MNYISSALIILGVLFVSSCAHVQKACDNVHSAADAYAKVLRELERQGIDPSKKSELIDNLKLVRNRLSQAHSVCFDD